MVVVVCVRVCVCVCVCVCVYVDVWMWIYIHTNACTPLHTHGSADSKYNALVYSDGVGRGFARV